MIFWQNILIKLQHAIKANQSLMIESVLIPELTRCSLKYHEVAKKNFEFTHETEPYIMWLSFSSMHNDT